MTNPAFSASRLTKRFVEVEPTDFLPDGSVVIAKMAATEDRASLPCWQKYDQLYPGHCIWVGEETGSSVKLIRRNSNETVYLRSIDGSTALPSTNSIYIDISGLRLTTWAPIIRAALDTCVNVSVVYTEPASYKPHPTPASPAVFDLSDGFEGLGPIPGFASLDGAENTDGSIFVAFLGFEGTRPQHIAITLEPLPPSIVPVVGFPGFRFDMAAAAIACNREFFKETDSHANIRYARASCPFDTFRLMSDVSVDYPNHHIYMAPVGTKPHALGALLFHIISPERTELLYDHPRRKPGRTTGRGTTHIYHIQIDGHCTLK